MNKHFMLDCWQVCLQVIAETRYGNLNFGTTCKRLGQCFETSTGGSTMAVVSKHFTPAGTHHKFKVFELVNEITAGSICVFVKTFQLMIFGHVWPVVDGADLRSSYSRLAVKKWTRNRLMPILVVEKE